VNKGLSFGPAVELFSCMELALLRKANACAAGHGFRVCTWPQAVDAAHYLVRAHAPALLGMAWGYAPGPGL